jgi:hypothetical protein
MRALFANMVYLFTTAILPHHVQKHDSQLVEMLEFVVNGDQIFMVFLKHLTANDLMGAAKVQRRIV